LQRLGGSHEIAFETRGTFDESDVQRTALAVMFVAAELFIILSLQEVGLYVAP
jgi:hypothetical protein